jgi:hypothetical protein
MFESRLRMNGWQGYTLWTKMGYISETIINYNSVCDIDIRTRFRSLKPCVNGAKANCYLHLQMVNFTALVCACTYRKRFINKNCVYYFTDELFANYLNCALEY